LISEVRKINMPFAHGVVAATVFMDSCARIELRRINIDQVAIQFSLNNYLTSAIRRPQFDPIDIIAIYFDLAETDRFSYDQIRRDRRFPGTVWSRRSHYSFPLDFRHERDYRQ